LNRRITWIRLLSLCLVLLVAFLLPSVSFAINQKTLDKLTTDVIECESSGRTTVYGDDGDAFGILQFHQKTFNWLKKKSGMKNLKRSSPIDQIKLFQWAVRHGYGGLWTCYRELNYE